MNYVNFQSRLRRNFSGSVNFKPVFSSDSVNVARPLSKTTTKSMSQPILYILVLKYAVLKIRNLKRLVLAASSKFLKGFAVKGTS